MHSLSPLTALGGTAPRSDSHAGLTLHERPQIAIASIAARMGRRETCLARLSTRMGHLPGPGKSIAQGPETLLWTGPDQWLLTAPYDPAIDLAAALKSELGTAASITEQSDAWVCFDLQGDGIVAVMELLCAANIRAMQTGDATRTTIHHLGCFILSRADGLRIIGPRAAAQSLHHALVKAMHAAL